MIGRASLMPLPIELQQRLAAPLAGVSAALAAISMPAPRRCAGSAAARDAASPHRAAGLCRRKSQPCRGEGLTRGVASDIAERFFALGFSLEQMRQNLKDLERCVAVWAGAPVTPTNREDQTR